jgi:hypothetical protein
VHAVRRARTLFGSVYPLARGFAHTSDGSKGRAEIGLRSVASKGEVCADGEDACLERVFAAGIGASGGR